MGFHPVLNERSNTPAANLDASVLWQMLALKAQHPLPQAGPLPDSFDFSLDRSAQCSTIETFPSYARRYPLQGMPFGLPALSAPEQALLRDWLADGAPAVPLPAAGTADHAQIAQWESFFNGPSNQQQLVARYLYEHLYLAHLYFADNGRFYTLVRSRTAPGLPVDRIAKARPFDDPGVLRVYYRLIPVRETIVSKTHMPYRLDSARMARWKALFFDVPYTVSEQPVYDLPEASNPFRTFAAIPVSSRYRFLLDEAQFTVMNFIKGPVCRGQQAVDVINDHFWVFFANPDLRDDSDDAAYLARTQHALQLPAALGSDAPWLGRWQEFADLQQEYLQHRRDYAQTQYPAVTAEQRPIVWDGDGHNPNAALTVFRHRDNASVHQGLLGEHPQRVWLLTYPLLERIYYLLVAGYDVFGNIGHQLDSRLYMDFLRIEAEQNYLAFYPQSQHAAIEQHWYREAPDRVLRTVQASRLDLPQPLLPELAGISLEAAQNRVLQSMQEGVSRLPFPQPNGGVAPDSPLYTPLAQLGQLKGKSLQWLPEYSVIRLTTRDGRVYWYSLLLNVAHTNVAMIFDEDSRRIPAEYSLTLLPGIVASYPNAFWRIDEKQLPDFVAGITAQTSAVDYRRLVDRFGLRRNAPDFWAFSDAAHAELHKQSPIDFGLLDYNRLENR